MSFNDSGTPPDFRSLGLLGGKRVVYTEERWQFLRRKRSRALAIMTALVQRGLAPVVHGSVARGDVRASSDVDVFIPRPVPSYLVEVALAEAGFSWQYREVVKATPLYVTKAYIHLDELTTVSFPLQKLSCTEREFYRFGGELDLEGLKKGRRVPGVTKQLVLIVPTEDGHEEYEVVGREHVVARVLGVSIATVQERVRVLTRRREVGRTGVFRKVVVPEGKSVEEVAVEHRLL